MTSSSPDTPPRVSKRNSTDHTSTRSGGLGRGQSPYFKLNSLTLMTDVANDLRGQTADQKTAKRSSSASDFSQTAGQSPPPKPPRKRSPRPQSKLADHSSHDADTPPSSSPSQPPRQTNSSQPSTDDTVYLPPVTKPSASSNYDNLLPKQKTDVYDHLGSNTTDLASLLPNTMRRYRSEAKQKPEPGTSTELRTPTKYPSNSSELTIGKNVSTGPKASDKMSEDTKNGEKAVNDGPANPPWRKLPRVAIKDEPEVNAHSWRNLRSSVTEPSLSPTCRDIEYSVEPRNFSQAYFHTPKNQCSLRADEKIEEEEEDRDEVTESNAEQQEPTADQSDETAESHPTMSLATVPEMRMDLEYSMEPRMYASRNQQAAHTMPLAAGNKGPKKKRRDGERKKKKREVSEKKDITEKLAEGKRRNRGKVEGRLCHQCWVEKNLFDVEAEKVRKKEGYLHHERSDRLI